MALGASWNIVSIFGNLCHLVVHFRETQPQIISTSSLTHSWTTYFTLLVFFELFIIFFLKVNTAREAPAVKFIKGKRGNTLTYMAIVSAPWGSAHRPRPMGAKKEEKTIYLTNCTFE
jgi:hypothetical protein